MDYYCSNFLFYSMRKLFTSFALSILFTIPMVAQTNVFKYGLSYGFSDMSMGITNHRKSIAGFDAHNFIDYTRNDCFGGRLMIGIGQRGFNFTGDKENRLQPKKVRLDSYNAQATFHYKVVAGQDGDPNIVLHAGGYGDILDGEYKGYERITFGYTCAGYVQWKNVEFGVHYSSSLQDVSKELPGKQVWTNLGFRANFLIAR
jgi:hypothetical protein